jgi:hypothetical protein
MLGGLAWLAFDPMGVSGVVLAAPVSGSQVVHFCAAHVLSPGRRFVRACARTLETAFGRAAAVATNTFDGGFVWGLLGDELPAAASWLCRLGLLEAA